MKILKLMMSPKIDLKALSNHKVFLSIALLVIALPASISAHQQKHAVTRVLFNPNTDNIEVMHRFFIHDAEHAASEIFGERQTLLESEQSRELFSSYVINRFSISAGYDSGEEEALQLQYVGAEVDGQFMWVYQEIPASREITSMTIVNLALRDVWSDQSNLVNIERGGEVYSLTFDGSADELRIELGD